MPFAKFGRIFRKHMPYWVILSILLGLVFGYFLPHQAAPLKKAIIPLLFTMIYVMIIPTNMKQFHQVIRHPKNVILGIVFISVLAPLIAYPLVHSVCRGYPEVGVGLILAATVPPGGMIAAWTGLLEGDIPLAVTLQAITLVVGIVQIPYALRLLAATSASIPIGSMVQTLVIIVVLPLVTGFASRWGIIRRWGEKPLKSFSPNLAVISGLCALGVVFIGAALKTHTLVSHPRIIGIGLAGAVSYYLLTYFISTALCRLGRIKYAQSIPLVYGTGTKNLSIAIALALASFPNTNVVLEVIACSMVQMPMASVFYKLIPWMLQKQD
ncbi:MAG TPA: arsenic resistance protein [Desulfobacteraceae bacterium]|nr:arsenic resistance protein [Desulfobacteraceae bacterium]